MDFDAYIYKVYSPQKDQIVKVEDNIKCGQMMIVHVQMLFIFYYLVNTLCFEVFD